MSYKGVKMAVQLQGAEQLFNPRVSERLKEAHFSDKNLEDLSARCAFLRTYAPNPYTELNPNKTLKTLYPQIAASPSVNREMAVMLAMLVSGYNPDVRVVESEFEGIRFEVVRGVTNMVRNRKAGFRVLGNGQMTFHPFKKRGAK